MSDTNAPRTITDFVLAESEIKSLRQQLAAANDKLGQRFSDYRRIMK